MAFNIIALFTFFICSFFPIKIGISAALQLDKKNQKSRQNDASPRKAYAGSPSCQANAHVIITLFRPICNQMVLIFNIAIQQGNNMAL